MQVPAWSGDRWTGRLGDIDWTAGAPRLRWSDGRIDPLVVGSQEATGAWPLRSASHAAQLMWDERDGVLVCTLTLSGTGWTGLESVDLWGDGLEVRAPWLDGARVLLHGLDQEWSDTVPLAGLDGEWDSRGVTAVARPGSGALAVGHLRFTPGIGDWTLSERSGGWAAAPRVVWPGGWLHDEAPSAQPLGLVAGASADTALGAWASAAADASGIALGERRPRGWYGWGWVDPFDDEPTESHVLENCRAWVDMGMVARGGDTVWVSLTYLPSVTPGRYLEDDRGRHPNGLGWLARQLSDLGMQLGLWCAPFWVADLPEERARWAGRLLVGEDGQPIVYAKSWQVGESGALPDEQRYDFLALDGAHPDVQSHIEAVFHRWAELGVTYCMVDFLEAGAGPLSPVRGAAQARSSDPGVVRGMGSFRGIIEAARRGAGDQMVLLSATGPTLETLPEFNGARVGSDHDEGRPRAPGTFWHPATWEASGWHVHRAVVRSSALRMPFDRRLYHAAIAGSMLIDEPVPANQARVSVALAASAGGILFAGDDVRSMSPERQRWLTWCSPEHGAQVWAPDAYAPQAERGTPSLLRTDHSVGRAEWSILTLLNPHPMPLSVPLEDRWLATPMDGPLEAFELFDARPLGHLAPGDVLTVAAHDARIVRLQRPRDHPWLLATDLHGSMGGVELAALTWWPSSQELSLQIEHVPGATGALWISLPRTWRPTDFRRHRIMRMRDQPHDIMHVRLSTDEEGRWSRAWRFEPIPAHEQTP